MPDPIKQVSPITTIEDALLDEKQIQLRIKREDLLYLESRPGNRALCGNKWRKLKYILQQAKSEGYKKLLTFGGAYSNHIAAVASAGHIFGFKTIGLIRGEETPPLNPTLREAIACGMQLHYINRTAYRQKNDPEFQDELIQKFGHFYSIPEGGTNALALKGCAELAREILGQVADEIPDYICLPCGTGGTLAGLILGMEGQSQLMGFAALKGDFLREEIQKLLRENNEAPPTNWQIQTDYHFGGFAKFDDRLIQFINTFRENHRIQLEPLYTGKLFFGIFDLIEKGWFAPGSRILAIHTGGLQGLEGFRERFGNII